MISSPCKTCDNVNLPKELCLETCEKVNSIQNLQHILTVPSYLAVDSSDSNRYRLSIPASRPSYE